MTNIPGGGADLDRWLALFLEVLGRKTRRTWAPLYLRGLLGSGERKSLQPMAARLRLGGYLPGISCCALTDGGGHCVVAGSGAAGRRAALPPDLPCRPSLSPKGDWRL